MKLPTYYRIMDDKIQKVIVNYDGKKLEELKYEIADNCTLVVHREFDGTKKDKPDILMCERYSQVEIGTSDSKLYECAPDEPLFHFDYDERVLPRLVHLILELEKGNIGAVEEIYNPIEDIDVQTMYEKRIRDLESEIDNISNHEYELKIKKLQELRDLVKEKEKNKDVKSDYLYYQRARELIKLIVADEISKKDVLRVQSFFDSEFPPKTELDYTKFVDKENIKEKK